MDRRSFPSIAHTIVRRGLPWYPQYNWAQKGTAQKGTSMIRVCQGKARFSLHLAEGVAEALYLVRTKAPRCAVADPLQEGSTSRRDQTSICENSPGPSAKIELG